MSTTKVIGFYSSKVGVPLREFSNFFRCSPPFDFHLPSYAKRAGFPDVLKCEFSEKAIMAIKAALMGDRPTFDRITEAKDPATCKKLGRAVTNFNAQLWEQHLEETAYEAVRQKFAADCRLEAVLLGTGDAILAEATTNDKIWGIGLNVGDPRVKDPSKWNGRNALGKALMRTRDFLRNRSAKPEADIAELAGSSNTSCQDARSVEGMGNLDGTTESSSCKKRLHVDQQGANKKTRVACPSKQEV